MEGTTIARLLKSEDRSFRGKELRIVNADNELRGMMTFEAALAEAESQGLDLVLVAEKAVPPVCRIMNYGKFVYEQTKHEKEARKKQMATQKVKEVKYSPNVDDHDLDIKTKRVIEFLQKGYKVKVTLFYRGRQMAHQEIGEDVLKRVLTEIEEHGHFDGEPQRAGRTVQVSVSPKSRK